MDQEWKKLLWNESSLIVTRGHLIRSSDKTHFTCPSIHRITCPRSKPADFSSFDLSRVKTSQRRYQFLQQELSKFRNPVCLDGRLRSTLCEKREENSPMRVLMNEWTIIFMVHCWPQFSTSFRMAIRSTNAEVQSVAVLMHLGRPQVSEVEWAVAYEILRHDDKQQENRQR